VSECEQDAHASILVWRVESPNQFT